MSKVIVVNENDQQLDLREYSEINYETIYRVSALWLTDTRTGDILMTQRKWTKHNDPGKWMAAASGTIEEGESYDDNIVHEIEEEIGLSGLDLSKGPKIYTDDGKHRYFVQWYIAKADKNKLKIVIQQDEVESYDWVPEAQLLRELNDNPDKFVPSLNRDMTELGYKV